VGASVNNPTLSPLQVTLSPTGSATGIIFGRVLYGSSSGVPTPVRATPYIEQLANFTGSIKSTNANDTIAGTGCRSIVVTYYNHTGDGPFTETVVPNGLSAVPLVNLNHCFIEKMECTTAGALGANAGAISLFVNTLGTGTVVGSIGFGNMVTTVGDNQTFWCHHYVPIGQTFSTYTLNGGTNGNQIGILFLRSSTPLVTNNTDMQISDIITLPNNGGVFSTRTLANPINVTGFKRVTALVISNGTNTNFFASFDFSEV